MPLEALRSRTLSCTQLIIIIIIIIIWQEGKIWKRVRQKLQLLKFLNLYKITDFT